MKYKTDVLVDEAYDPVDGEYTVTYENNTAVGKATIILRGTGDDSDGDGLAYIGTKRVTFNISGNHINKAQVRGLLKSYTYTGEEIRPFELTEEGHDESIVKVTYRVSKEEEPTELKEDVHYTVFYQKNVNRGTAVLILEGMEEAGYTGTKKLTFKIMADTIESDGDDPFVVTITDKAAVQSEEKVQIPYMKGGAKPAVMVKSAEDVVLIPGIDYTVTYKNNTKVADSTSAKVPTIVVKGKGNYVGIVEVPFEIIPKDLNDSKNEGDVYIAVKDKVYSNKKNGWKQSIAVYDADGKKLNTRDYHSLEYTVGKLPADSDSPLHEGEVLHDMSVMPAGSEVKVNITMTGNYIGKVTGTYRILETGYDISKATIQIYPQEYTGKAVVIDENQDFKKSVLKDGKVEKRLYLVGDMQNIAVVGYEKNINKGTAKVTFKGVGNYGGTKTVTFKIGQRSIQTWFNEVFDSWKWSFN